MAENYESLAKVAGHLVDIITIHDAQSRYLYVSPSLEKLLGMPASNFIGKTTWQMGLDASLCRFFDDSLRTAISERKNLTVEYYDGTDYYQSILSTTFDQLDEVESVIVVSRNITESKKQEQKKNDFISLVGHELKTPVTTLKGLIQLAKKSLHTGNVAQTVLFLEKADAQLLKQVSTIDYLMQVSRIDSNKIRLNYEMFRLGDLLDDCIEQASIYHDAGQITVQGDANTTVSADKDRLGQVIDNILRNASRYSSPESKINITVTSDDNVVAIAITDSGIGISDEQLPYIFDRFYRANEYGKYAAGLGLGLFISHEIMELHHGKIKVNSSVNAGSTFTIVLPIENNRH